MNVTDEYKKNFNVVLDEDEESKLLDEWHRFDTTENREKLPTLHTLIDKMTDLV